MRVRRTAAQALEGLAAAARSAKASVLLGAVGADVMGLRGLLRTIEGGDLGFWCPGCDEMHVLSPGWKFNGNYDAPTFTPSVLVTSGCKTPQHKPGDSCWCTWNAEAVAAGLEPSAFACSRCHSFVTDGRIQFLTDSTHKLAGQTVPLVVPR